VSTIFREKGNEFFSFLVFLAKYLARKTKTVCLHFESLKNFIVDWLLWKRGMLHRPFTHASLLLLAFAVLISASFVKGSSLFATGEETLLGSEEQNQIAASFQTPITIISEKPRDKIIEYEVLGGDTVSGISDKFAISVETIKWANNMSDVDDIYPGDTLKILPVSGVAHTVGSGDTIYSVAKKYQAEAQAILDFPFNEVGDNFSLKAGQILIVPDGAPPAKPKPPPTQYLAKVNIPQGPISAVGQFLRPAFGQLAQYFSWYHPAIDISNLAGGPIKAADSGKVIVAGWPDSSGYGRRIIIDHGNGFTTLYAHLSSTAVSAGQYVSRGQTIGMMGSTGRSTGVHVHLEIRKNGVALNPLSLLK
jgi:murein DD-endopeptidase MepM/ murein hydrolase activator NlpD